MGFTIQFILVHGRCGVFGPFGYSSKVLIAEKNASLLGRSPPRMASVAVSKNGEMFHQGGQVHLKRRDQ